MPLRVGLRVIEQYGNESLENQVLAYEAQPFEKGQIVFYGPSYFTRWSTKYGEIPMAECLKGASGKKCVINRGFGSSCAEHQLYYYPRMVRPLEPRVLVLEGYANSDSFGYSPEEVFEIMQRVVAYAKTDFPGIHIYMCSGHRSLKATEKIREDIKVYSKYVEEFAKETSDVTFVDVYNYEPMIRDDIFIEDGVHFNSLGYQVFAEFFKENLKEELEKF